ncbi:MAG TPA: biopolymer transporter ExbD [Candidatus Eisenbacteria bacterium]|jgi:biopolymer transport protein ExbD|nr:biopolymer transporter ExbD [Candidatus Eisenbacteria bacterium]
MRFKRLKRRTSIEKGQLDIAPMVDVMFNLLIFFMLTSNFVLQSGIKVLLPKAITSEVLSGESIVINVTGQDLLFLNDRPVTIADLMTELKAAARENKSLLLRADTGASLGRVVEIWDLCREYGIPQINIATNQKPGEEA